jgi:hypothetical protein
MSEYSLIVHCPPKGIEPKYSRPFSLVDVAEFPSLRIGGSTWARMNLRLFVDLDVIRAARLLQEEPPEPCELQEFLKLRDRVGALLPTAAGEMLVPGVRFGVPRVRLTEPVWCDLLYEICSERFRVAFEAAKLVGAVFHPVDVVSGHSYSDGRLFCIEAPFSRLSPSDRAKYDSDNPGWGRCVIPPIEETEFLVPPSLDIARLPFMYGGFMVSRRARDLIVDSGLDWGVEFRDISTASG